ncbi:hypothetical protein U9M48_001357 [Paspalum notatum var. saurae]|uniref:Rx N-terminal domain-containing protein n=1 Tax=Paspalum notatum var. saurae TaxID=547442 RepID=A0AAQ3SCW2_PASNO
MAAGAEGAVDSLLGRLTSVLLDEAHLLSGLRGDVEFIRDEMETMNGMLRQLTEAQHRNHLVRAWMKQVTGLARDCEGNVELYIHRVGGSPVGADPDAGIICCLLAHLRRLVRLLQTVPVRHQIATRIRELKDRARDVDDRRRRYGITVPDSLPAAGGDHIYDAAGEAQYSADTEEDLRRLAIIFEGSGSVTEKVAEGVYQHPDVGTFFERKALSLSKYYVPDTLIDIVEKIAGVKPKLPHEYWRLDHDDDVVKRVMIVANILWAHLKGKRFFIVIKGVKDEQEWRLTLDALLHAAGDGCRAGSAILMTTMDDQVARSSSHPFKIFHARSTILHELYDRRDYRSVYRHIMGLPGDPTDHALAKKTFLHLLCIKTKWTYHEITKYLTAIAECHRLNRSILKQVLMWCYDELPSKYKSCLLYLTIFPKGHVIRSTSLARRWVAEGLITASTAATGDETQSPTDEAERYLDVLFIRGFVSPSQISAAGNIKSFTVHYEVQEFIARMARDVSFVETTQPSDLARHLSIHSRIGLPRSSDGVSKGGIAAYLPSLAVSPQWILLSVLDLEGCKGLNKKKHLKSICKILLLKFLSLRNTDVTELPKQIKDLHCLETLDIRQTKVQRLSKKAIVFPLLKHFLAGNKVSGSTSAARISKEESPSAVEIPLGIQRMKDMEILSHVQVSNSDDSALYAIAQLLKLRKLGVALHSEDVKLDDLLHQIENLSACLRSLSIRIQYPAAQENQRARKTDASHQFPNFIERLNICSITGALISSIKDHHQLVKITLSETSLGEEDIRILGKLSKLRGLRLLHNSYTAGSKLNFKTEEFQHLRLLVVDCSNITNISFDNGAASNLEMMLWSFITLEALSGLGNLRKLMKLELNGDCGGNQLDSVKEQTIGDPDYTNYLKIEHNRTNQHHGDGTAVQAS